MMTYIQEKEIPNLLEIPTGVINGNYGRLNQYPMAFKGFISKLADIALNVKRTNAGELEHDAETEASDLKNFPRKRLVKIGDSVSPVCWEDTKPYRKLLEALKSGQEFAIYRGCLRPKTQKSQIKQKMERNSFTSKFLNELGIENKLYDFITDEPYRNGIESEYEQEFDMSE